MMNALRVLVSRLGASGQCVLLGASLGSLVPGTYASTIDEPWSRRCRRLSTLVGLAV